MKAPDFKDAIKRYQTGERPWSERKVNWHLVTKSGELIPLKYIYAMATGSITRDFNTYRARRAAVLADYGVIDLSFSLNIENEEFNKKVAASLRDPKGRRRRLSRARKKPGTSLSLIKVFKRNPDVVAEVLSRANGRCEKCRKSAPFLRAKDKSPYLEVHHVKTLANGGEDTVKNAIALCPNCHRESHYG